LIAPQFERGFKELNIRSKNGLADLRRREILASATRAIREHGWRGSGMREIARAAGLSTGNLYYYFRNKQELIYFCQDQALNALIEVAHQAAAFTEARHRLATVIDGHLRVVLTTGAALHLDLDELPRALHKKLIHKRDRYEHAVRELIAEGQARRQVRDGDPKLLTFALLGALNWATRWYRPDGEFSIDEISESFAQQLLGGLLCHRH
jgi:AcrR family transcriptional regulator